jgi:hypothetical protein
MCNLMTHWVSWFALQFGDEFRHEYLNLAMYKVNGLVVFLKSYW